MIYAGLITNMFITYKAQISSNSYDFANSLVVII